MKKKTSTKERVLALLVGPSGSGKTHLNFDKLRIGTFENKFGKTFLFLSLLHKFL